MQQKSSSIWLGSMLTLHTYKLFSALNFPEVVSCTSKHHADTLSNQSKSEPLYNGLILSISSIVCCMAVTILYSIIMYRSSSGHLCITMHSCFNANPVTLLVKLGIQPGKVS